MHHLYILPTVPRTATAVFLCFFYGSQNVHWLFPYTVTLVVFVTQLQCVYCLVEWKRNVMAHAQNPDLVFQRNGRVHLYRRRCQFSRLLAAEVCASAVIMLDRPCSHTVHECWLPTPFVSFPFTSPPVLRRVPSDSVSTLRPRSISKHIRFRP